MLLIKSLCALLGLLAVLLSVISADSDHCKTADGNPGRCMPARLCLKITEIFKNNNEDLSNLTPYEKELLLNSHCGRVHGEHFVCCNNTQSRINTNGLEILKNQDCGKLIQFGIESKKVRLGSRPWMALLKYRNFADGMFKCGGTLITERYVLTAAQCIPKDRKELISVRLGEHKISTQRDCSNYAIRKVCLPPFEDIGIDEIVVHEAWQGPEFIYNDIALLRLNRPVEFNVHIHPICLPLNATLQQEAESKDDFYLSGWGITHKNNTGSDKPMKTRIQSQERSKCLSLGYKIKGTQLCAGDGESDSCVVDSGGPLARITSYFDKTRMVQFGIFSSGESSGGKCSLGVYTNIASFMPWITHKISDS